jgi:agmatinase
MMTDTIFNQPDHSLYSNAMTFLRQPLSHDPINNEADIAILGLPFDMATSGRSGARMGPNAIRQASVNLAWEYKRFPWDFSLSKHTSLIDAGDLVFAYGDPEQFSEISERAATQIINSGKTLLSLGGDHFVTLPLLRAHAKKYGKMALIHFDAHTDTYSEGNRYDHGTMFYHAPKENLIDKNHSVQIGIRTDYARKDHGFNVISAPEANDLSAANIAANIKKTIGDLPVYLTFDIDCIDPAYAPGTGTPVCGGLTTDKVLKILHALRGINIVGMDVTEVAPSYDHSEITGLAGATVALELLYLWTAYNKL